MASPRHFLLIILTFTTAVIVAAWGFQVIGGYQPCGLCYQQRQPYYVAIPVALIAIFFWKKIFSNPLMQKGALTLLLLIFGFSAFLAGRHAGVEWEWWLGPGNCAAGDLSGFGDGQSLIEALENTTVAFCDEAALRIFGLSFAGWNFIASVMLMAFAALGLRETLRKTA